MAGQHIAKTQVLMCFDGPFGSIKSHEVEGPSKHMRFSEGGAQVGPSKHMRFLGPSKHMRFQEGKGPSKNMRFLGPPKHMRFRENTLLLSFHLTLPATFYFRTFV